MLMLRSLLPESFGDVFWQQQPSHAAKLPLSEKASVVAALAKNCNRVADSRNRLATSAGRRAGTLTVVLTTLSDLVDTTPPPLPL